MSFQAPGRERAEGSGTSSKSPGTRQDCRPPPSLGGAAPFFGGCPLLPGPTLLPRGSSSHPRAPGLTQQRARLPPGAWVARGLNSFLASPAPPLPLVVVARTRAGVRSALRPGPPAKCITALPSRDGRQLPGPMAASASPALPGAARTTHPGRQSPAAVAGRRRPWRDPESPRIQSSADTHTPRESGEWRSCGWGGLKRQFQPLSPRQSQKLGCHSYWVPRLVSSAIKQRTPRHRAGTNHARGSSTPT